MPVRTRFAPSPTGYLHVGGARTALFSWLVARKAKGQFVLRIEDTDRERSTAESVKAILDGMDWLGLDYDEGPFYQTQRFDQYRAAVQKLLDADKAYHCYCSRERLDEMREAQRAAGEKPRYDGHCRDLAEPVDGVDPVVRFRNPTDGDVVFQDLIKGEIRISNRELDDLVIARSDGTPTYNLTVVVDDADMQLSQVVRGDDHINNTPRQINLYKALGLSVPQFAHVPMILGSDGARLSKRHGAVSVLQYRDEGYLPEALLNYLVRLGWSHGDQELFSREEMIKLFDLNAVNKAASSFNTEKLQWLNQQYMRSLPAAYVVSALEPHLEALGFASAEGPDLAALVQLQAERCHTLREMAEASRFFFADDLPYDEKAAKKHLRGVTVAPLEAAHQALAAVEDWQASTLHQVLDDTAKALEVGFGKVALPVRIATTFSGASPELDITLELLGQKRVLARIQRAIEFCAARAAAS